MSYTQSEMAQLLDFLITNIRKNTLTFGISDALGGAVIHTYSKTPHEFNLNITNKVSADISLVGISAPVSCTNYHFSVKFTGNPIFYGQSTPTLKTANWQIAFDKDKNVYFLTNNTITLKPDQTLQIKMDYVDAEPVDATSNVISVAVNVGHNVKVNIGGHLQPVHGTETVFLSAIVDTAAPTPLVATLVESKTVLNDRSSSTLTLRMVNTTPDPVHFAKPKQGGNKTATAIVLRVDLDDSAAWALCKSSEASLLQIEPPQHWLGDQDGKIGTGEKTWTFYPDLSNIGRIDPYSALEFKLRGIKTTLPPGFTNLYIKLLEFPIYGSQTLVSEIEKSPLIYNKDARTGLVTRGTAGDNVGLQVAGDTTKALFDVAQSGKGQAALFNGGEGVHIVGDTHRDLLHVEQSGNGGGAFFSGGSGVHVEKDLTVDGEIKAGGAATLAGLEVFTNTKYGIYLGLKGSKGGVLTISNNVGDNGIYLEAYNTALTDNAKFLAIGGKNYDPKRPLPLIELQAAKIRFLCTTLELQAATKITVAKSSLFGITTNGRIGNKGGDAVFTHLPTNKGGRVVTSPLTLNPEIHLSGEATLVEGSAQIRFDEETVDLLTDEKRYLVFLTPAGSCHGLWVSERSSEGFTVKELHGGDSSCRFDWLVIAHRPESHEDKRPRKMPDSSDLPLTELETELPTPLVGQTTIDPKGAAYGHTHSADSATDE